MAEYSRTSPWANTNFGTSGNLSYFNIRSIPAESDDVLYELEPQYIYRPDLLSYDIYGLQNCGGYLHKEIWMFCKILFMILCQEQRYTYQKKIIY